MAHFVCDPCCCFLLLCILIVKIYQATRPQEAKGAKGGCADMIPCKRVGGVVTFNKPGNRYHGMRIDCKDIRKGGWGNLCKKTCGNC